MALAQLFCTRKALLLNVVPLDIRHDGIRQQGVPAASALGSLLSLCCAALCTEEGGPTASLSPLQVDVWAAGVCLYVWIFGQLPFPALSMVDMFAAIRTQAVAFPDSPAASEEVKDLIGQVRPPAPSDCAVRHAAQLAHPGRPTDPIGGVCSCCHGVSSVHGQGRAGQEWCRLKIVAHADHALGLHRGLCLRRWTELLLACAMCVTGQQPVHWLLCSC